MKNIIEILTSISLNAAAQTAMRKAMIKNGEITFDNKNILSYLPQLACNPLIWLSFLCYGLSIMVWIVVLSKVEVSYAYAFSSIGYILVTLLGILLLHENVSLFRIIGIIIVCLGVFVVARS
jgi:multidrug transporter EmrE-like cation transporter